MKGSPKTWKALSRHANNTEISVSFTLWIAKHFEKMAIEREKDAELFSQGKITNEQLIDRAMNDHANSFSLQTIMMDNGLDWNKRNDYAKAMRFFSEHRKLLEYAMEVFWSSIEYAKLKGDGVSEDEIWNKLMYAATTWNVYPLWSDPCDNRKYKLLELNGYLEMLKRHVKTGKTIMKGVVKSVETALIGLPSVAENILLPTKIEIPQIASEVVVEEVVEKVEEVEEGDKDVRRRDTDNE